MRAAARASGLALAVAHDSPGRLRLRVPIGASGEALARSLAGLDGVVAADWSPLTRSLLVRYDPAAGARGALLEAVAERGGFAVRPAVGDLEPPPGPARDHVAAAAVTGTVAAIDARVRRVTAGAFGLRTILPFGLGLWALSELARGRARPLAWSSALWYAHGLIRDYQGPPHARQDTER